MRDGGAVRVWLQGVTRSRAAFIAAGLLAAVFPPLYVFLGSWQTAGYNSATFLGVLAVYLLTRAVRPGVTDVRRTVAVAAAGLAAGVALYQQPISAFAIAAVGTTTLVATWPRGLTLLRARYVVVFAALALVGASPEIVAVAGGLGTDTANDPLPPGYQLTPGLLATVAGFDLFGTSPEDVSRRNRVDGLERDRPPVLRPATDAEAAGDRRCRRGMGLGGRHSRDRRARRSASGPRALTGSRTSCSRSGYGRLSPPG